MGPANSQALNRYAYVMNNPLKYTDPSGHCPHCAVGALLAAAGITISAPVIVAVAAVISIVALAVFLSDETNRVWLDQQLRNGVSDVNAFVQSLQEQMNISESRWRERETDVGSKKVRKLRDNEVPQEAHRQKRKGNPLGATDSYYVDKDGNLYSGNENGELTQEGHIDDYEP